MSPLPPGSYARGPQIMSPTIARSLYQLGVPWESFKDRDLEPLLSRRPFFVICITFNQFKRALPGLPSLL